VKVVPPRPFTGKADAPPPHLWYVGGLGVNPTPGHYTVKVQFESNGAPCQSTFPVDVVSVTAEVVTIRTANPDPLNIAPEGDTEIVIIPGRQLPVPRGALVRWP